MTAHTLFFSRLRTMSLVALISVTVFFCVPPTLATAQAELADTFCSLPSPLLLGSAGVQNDVIEGNLQDLLTIQNLTPLHIGGVTTALGVYTDGVLTHIYVGDEDVSLEPQSTNASRFDVDISTLEPGEYTYQLIAVQGTIENVVAELQLQRPNETVAFTKVGESERILSTEVLVGDETFRGGQIELTTGSPLEVFAKSTNVTSAPLFDVELDIVATRGVVPFGTAVVDIEVDEAKLFPGSSRVTSLRNNFAQPGTHSVYVLQHIPGTLMPVTSIPVQIGSIVSEEYATRLAVVGVQAPTTEQQQVTAVICLEQLVAGEIIRESLAEVPVQLSQPESGFESEIVFNNLRSSVLSALPIFTDEGVTEVSLLKPRPGEVIEIEEYVPAQTFSFAFDCERHSLCDATVVEVAVDFVQEDTVQTSLWFYAGIIIAALLLGVLAVGRLSPVAPTGKEKIKMKMPTK